MRGRGDQADGLPGTAVLPVRAAAPMWSMRGQAACSSPVRVAEAGGEDNGSPARPATTFHVLLAADAP
ncbi:hypothetical protein [Nocardia jiangsuensis]|uniref:Uncharacterized protein n=1 Tax=Nocardia jiangsuensis TaxID=1691563 RepID=A0ABV8DSM9_9NOCA